MPLSLCDMKPESVWECVFVCFICMCAGFVKYVHLFIWVSDCAGEGGGKGEKRKC